MTRTVNYVDFATNTIKHGELLVHDELHKYHDLKRGVEAARTVVRHTYELYTGQRPEGMSTAQISAYLMEQLLMAESNEGYLSIRVS